MSDKVKVAIIRQRYNAAGGAERFVQNALMQLKDKSQMSVDILARNWKEIEGVNFKKINPPYFGSWWRDLGFSKAVRSYLKDNHYEIVQSHERIPGCQIYRAGDGLHARWMNLRQRAGFPASRLNLHHSYLLKAEKEMFNSEKLQYIICNSKMVMNEIAQWFPVAQDKCILIYNGVDLERFSVCNTDEVRKRVRSKLGIKEDQPTLVFLGSGFQRKGLRLAIEAISAASKDICLIVIGTDKEQQQYINYAKSLLGEKRVRFVGKTRPDEYLASADGFLLPTLYDPFPNSAMEAFASGLPVLTTLQCGAAEKIQNGENGFVFDYFNKKDAIQAIGHWIDAASNWAMMRKRARQTVESMSIERTTQEILELYSKILK